MSQEYIFEYQGTKLMFLDSLKKYPNNNDTFFYFDNYIVKLIENEIHFGVERAGHSGGYWFIPQITEYENKIEFRGEIQFIGPVVNRSKIRKIRDDIFVYLICVLFLPITLLLLIGCWNYNKINNRKKTKIKTTEDRLFDLLENHLGCTRKPID